MRYLNYLVAVVMLTACAGAQEIARIDLTEITQREQLRLPPLAPKPTKGYDTETGGACVADAPDRASLRVSLLWINPVAFSNGDLLSIELKIENIGKLPTRVPVYPHLSELQPSDAALSFDYTEIKLGLDVRIENQAVSLGNFILFGAENDACTWIPLKPGEWVRIRGNLTVDISARGLELLSSKSPEQLSNPQVSLWRARFAPESGGSYVTDLCPITEYRGGTVVRLLPPGAAKAN